MWGDNMKRGKIKNYLFQVQVLLLLRFRILKHGKEQIILLDRKKD